jgi:hypothetical protein
MTNSPPGTRILVQEVTRGVDIYVPNTSPLYNIKFLKNEVNTFMWGKRWTPEDRKNIQWRLEKKEKIFHVTHANSAHAYLQAVKDFPHCFD